MKNRIRGAFVIAILVTGIALTGCLVNRDNLNLIQTGSSTLLPLAIAWAEEFDKAEISVSGGGSSHGLNALLTGEADLGDASRKIKSGDYEKVGCSVTEDAILAVQTGLHPWQYPSCNGVTPTEWIVAYDVLVVIINPENDWASKLNYAQLYKIFTDDEPAIYWDEVPGLENAPHERIEIYAPDEASGTYDFFFEQIIPNWGKEGQKANPRLEAGDGVYHPSADDNVILNAIAERKYAIGYFGYAYYKENPEKVKLVWIAKEGANYIEPSLENVDKYPMARPLHIYTNGIPEERNVINEYLRFILSEEGQKIVFEIGYVPLSMANPDELQAQLKALGVI